MDVWIKGFVHHLIVTQAHTHICTCVAYKFYNKNIVDPNMLFLLLLYARVIPTSIICTGLLENIAMTVMVCLFLRGRGVDVWVHMYVCVCVFKLSGFKEIVFSTFIYNKHVWRCINMCMYVCLIHMYVCV